MRILGSWPERLIIKSIADAKAFCDGLMSYVDIPDVENIDKYYAIEKASDGRVLFGIGKLGKDAILADLVVTECDEEVYLKVFAARKSINCWLRKRNEL